MLVSVTSVAAAGLKPITSVPCLRSCRLRGVSSLLAQKNMETGAAIWRCTQSLGSEPGIDCHSYVFSVVKCINSDSSHCRARRDYWEKLKPASGRPFCPSLSKPDSWGISKGHADLMQKKKATSQEEMKALFQKAENCQ